MSDKTLIIILIVLNGIFGSLLIHSIFKMMEYLKGWDEANKISSGWQEAYMKLQEKYNLALSVIETYIPQETHEQEEAPDGEIIH